MIINKEQFGYLTDAYYWCKYLRDEYEISFICFDTGIQTYSYDRIFLVAEKNVRVSPEYVLVGISTANSKVLGKIIKKEFGCLLEGKE